MAESSEAKAKAELAPTAVTVDDALSAVPLDASNEAIAKKLIKTDDADEFKDLTALFNLNSAKKNALRIIKLNSLLDAVSDQAIERVRLRPDEISNKELLDFMTVVQDSIDRSQSALDQIKDAPAIAPQQTNIGAVNVNLSGDESLTRESKAKVVAAVMALMKFANSPQGKEQADVIDAEAEDAAKDRPPTASADETPWDESPMDESDLDDPDDDN